jgi:hypothetical protein
MLNLNLNIIGAGGRSNIGAGPNIGPTTTTTTTSTTTTSTTTTIGPVSLRTDPYSASLVYAVPGAQFGSTYGQESFRSDISSYIRGTGTSFSDAELPITSSGAPFGKGTFTASLQSVALWSGYPSAIEISGSNGSGSLSIKASGTASQFEFRSADFTIETYINYQNAQTGGYTEGSPGPANTNATMYWQYEEGSNPGFGFNTNGAGFQNPGVRFLIFSSTGAAIYYDTATLPRQANQWYHFGSQRSGSLFSSLWSGSAVQSFTFGGLLGTGSANFPFYIMGDGESSVKCHRYQDYRIYNGVAKYSGLTSGSTYTLPESMVIA